LLGLCSLVLALEIALPTFPFFNFIRLFTHIRLYIAKAIRLPRKIMKIRLRPFNIYLWWLLLVVSLACQAADEPKRKADEKKHKNEASTLRLYLEASTGSDERVKEVPIFRANPVMIRVEKDPLQIDEGNVVQGMVLDIEGGFVIKVQLDKRGTWVLENITASNVGKRLAIFSQCGEARWLAAPLISRRISDGVITFTPDADRAESERFVRGLNNVAAKIQKKNKF
jgi:hypothetical protein